MGHPPAAVWKYTPRQINAFLFIADKRRVQERIESLSIGVMAARGDEKEVKKQLKEWSRQ